MIVNLEEIIEKLNYLLKKQKSLRKKILLEEAIERIKKFEKLEKIEK